MEARIAKLVARNGNARKPGKELAPGGQAETIQLREMYLKRLEELVRFETLRKENVKFVADVLHGCGAGYLDRALADHGIAVRARRAERDVLFDGTRPGVSEEQRARL